MRRVATLPRAATLVALLAAALPAQQPRGKAVYDQWCAGCHGDTGAGDGEAASYMLPRPRDFTRGVFKIRTTASGEIPTDADLRRVIDFGMPGTAMPGWKGRLDERERDDVIAYVKSFSQFFTGTTATAVAIGDGPGSSAEAVAAGRTVYEKLECWKCHGQAARGDGTSAPTLKDDWGHPIRAADLSASWNFRGGSSVEEIYARLRTGLDGTPMPSFTDAVENKLITDEQLWQVAHYVRSLSPAEPPPVREVLRARLATALPAGPGDEGWSAAERQWVPLAGQIIIKPRWFAPMVDGVWVQALHDGTRLALRVSWHDPSRSPAPAWDEWLGRIGRTMTDADGALATRQGPDRLAIQFPAARGEGAELPYFLQGSTRRPAHLWRWTSEPEAAEEGTATGLGRFSARAGAREITHASRYDAGEWQVQFTRALASADTATPRFIPGETTPIGFFVADGSNGEDDVRGAVSAWYAIYLDVPTPTRVYLAPVAGALLTAGLGLGVVAGAQRRARREDNTKQEG